MTHSEPPDPTAVSRVLRLGASAGGALWAKEELGAMLRHQLAAPLAVDLGHLDPALSPKLRTLAAAQGLVLNSFADLLFHAQPPLELLILAKEFAKAHTAHTDSPLPRDVALVLYYGCIAAALVKGGKRISDLGDDTLGKGLAWCQAQEWVDPPLQALLRQAAAQLPGNRP